MNEIPDYIRNPRFPKKWTDVSFSDRLLRHSRQESETNWQATHRDNRPSSYPAGPSMKISMTNEYGDGTPITRGRAPTERQKRMANFPIYCARIDDDLLEIGSFFRDVHEAATSDPESSRTHEAIFSLNEQKDEAGKPFAYSTFDLAREFSELRLEEVQDALHLLVSELMIPDQTSSSPMLQGLEDRIYAQELLEQWRYGLHPWFDSVQAAFVDGATLGEIGLMFNGNESDKSKLGREMVGSALQRLRFLLQNPCRKTWIRCRKGKAAAPANDNLKALRPAA